MVPCCDFGQCRTVTLPGNQAVVAGFRQWKVAYGSIPVCHGICLLLNDR